METQNNQSQANINKPAQDALKSKGNFGEDKSKEQKPIVAQNTSSINNQPAKPDFKLSEDEQKKKDAAASAASSSSKSSAV